MKYLKPIFLIFLIGFSFCSLGQTIDELIEQGKASFEEKDYQKALEIWSQAVDKAELEGDSRKLAETLSFKAKSHSHLYQMDEAYKYYGQAAQIGKENNFLDIYSEGINAQTVIAFFQTKFDVAKQLSWEMIAIAEDSTIVSDAYTMLGHVHVDVGSLDSAIFYFEKAIAIDLEMENARSLPYNYSSLGDVYQAKGQNLKALDHFFLGMDYLRLEKDSFKLATFNRLIGGVFIQINNLVKAREYLEESVAISSHLGLKKAKSLALNKLGLIDLRESKLDAAQNNFNQALTLFITRKVKLDIMTAHDNLARVAMKRGDLELAEKELAFAQAEIAEDKVDSEIIGHLTALAEYNILNGRIEAANEYLRRIDLTGKRDVSPFLDMTMHGLYNKLYRSSSNYKLAMSELESMDLIEDSLFKLGQDFTIHELEAQYNKVQDEKEIASLDADNKIQSAQLDKRNTIIWVFGITSVFAIIIGFILLKQYKVINRTKKKLESQNVTISRALQEKELLLKEIHHRVKNNLQMVSSLLSIQSRDIQDKQALEAVNESRNRVRSMALIHNDLYKDDNLMGIEVKEYISNLSQSLFNSYKIDNDQIELKTDIDSLRLDVDTTIPLGLILNELITNCLKYAFPDNQVGEIKVSLKKIEGSLQLQVADNGIGMPKERVISENTFGIRMLKAFAAKLDASWEVLSDEGTTVRFSIKKFKMI